MFQEEKLELELDANLAARVKIDGAVCKIDAEGLYYKDLNSLLRAICHEGARKVEIHGVCGQRYIGTGIDSEMQIEIYGTPGNDLGAFMNGPKITVHGNAQDACGNTLNEGLIVVHGCAGDLTGHSMRGGKIFIRDGVGYRVGIHMKEYQKKKPTLVIGGVTQDFFGEYMAGGVALVLGMNVEGCEKCKARFVGAGMHGGVIYTRGDIFGANKDLKIAAAGKRDMRIIAALVCEYCDYFGFNYDAIMGEQFCRITPLSKRPYEKLYSH